MIGKIISDRSGFTKLLGGEVNQVYKIIVKLDVIDDEWKTLVNEINAADGDTVKINLAIDKAGLKNVDGLHDHVINQVTNGKEIDNGSVNNLIQTQNYKNIADQAHGILGVKNAIDKYNEGIKNGTLNATKFSETISQSNSSLDKEISQNAQAVLEQSAIWSDPDTTDQMKTTMTNALAQIDWSDAKFEGFDGEQAANYIQTTFASSFENLSPDDKIAVDTFFNSDPNNTDINQYIDLYEKIKEIFEKQGIEIPINIENARNVKNDFNKSLEQMCH